MLSRRLPDILRGWSWYLALAMLAAAAASYLVARQVPPIYESHARLLVNLASRAAEPGDADVSGQLAASYSQLVTAPEVLERAAELLGFRLSADQLGHVVSVQPTLGGPYVTLSATGSDPVLVHDSVESVASAFVEEQRQSASRRPVTVSLIEPATPATTLDPALPLPLLVGLAAAAGLFLALEVIRACGRREDGIRSAHDLERVAGLPHLGRVGRLRADSAAPMAHQIDPRIPALRAVHLLRSRLDFAAVDEPVGCVLVTSALPGEGKSTILAQLALSLAHAGRRVIAVDANVRGAILHRLFDVEDRPGLVDVLHTHRELDALDEYLQQGPLPGLQVLAAGAAAADASSLLASPRLPRLLRHLEQQADVVLVDGPAAIAASEALDLARAAGTTLLVVAAGRTPAAAVRPVVDALRHTGTLLIGAVLNQVPRNKRRATAAMPHEPSVTGAPRWSLWSGARLSIRGGSRQ